MTPRALSARLAKLEAERTSGWHAWRDVPVQQWPDAALLSLLDLPADCTEAELQALMHAPGRPQSDVAESTGNAAASSRTRLVALEPGNPGTSCAAWLDTLTRKDQRQ
jgi:hypothetical protein